MEEMKSIRLKAMKFTGERYVPEIEGQIALEHLHRYALASALAEGKHVLDIASGEGYGSHILAQVAASVIGVDISEEAITHAKAKYIKNNIEFRIGSVADIPVQSESIDLVVSFETIEHVSQHEEMLSEVKRVLKPNGILLISSPNKQNYSVIPNYTNPYHLKELFREEFEILLGRHFKHCNFSGQKIVYGSLIFPYGTDQVRPTYFEAKTNSEIGVDPVLSIYEIAIASDDPSIITQTSFLCQQLENSNIVKELKIFLAEKDYHLNLLRQKILAYDEAIAGFKITINNEADHIVSLNNVLTEREDKIENLNCLLAERDRQIDNINHALNEMTKKNAVLNNEILRLESLITKNNEIMVNQQSTIEQIYCSNSWKISAPLRIFFKELRKLHGIFNTALNKILPFGSKRRSLVKKILLQRKVKLFRPKSIINIEDNKHSNRKILRCEPDQVMVNARFTVSVIIPTFNGISDLVVLLPNLIKQIGLKKLEIIVVDSGSTDGTIDICKQFNVKIIEIKKSDFSHSFARNLGANSALNDYLLFMVQDALPTSEKWVYEMIIKLEEYKVAALSCGEFPKMNADLFSRMQLWYHNNFMGISDDSDRLLKYPKRLDYVNMRKNSQLNNVACLIKKTVFQKYNFRNNYAEDIDLGIRLIKDGHNLSLVNSTKVIHSHNRNPYYVLRRSFVDDSQLKCLFKDYNKLTISKDDLCKNSILMYQVISELCDKTLEYFKMGDRIEILRGKFISNFIYLLKNSHNLTNNSLIECRYVDHDFFKVIESLEQEIKEDSLKIENTMLCDQMLPQLDMIFAYVASLDSVWEPIISEEVKVCLFKIFATNLGIWISNTAESDMFMNELKLKLASGI